MLHLKAASSRETYILFRGESNLQELMKLSVKGLFYLVVNFGFLVVELTNPLHEIVIGRGHNISSVIFISAYLANW